MMKSDSAPTTRVLRTPDSRHRIEPALLARAAVEFLEFFAEEPLVDAKFEALIGSGDGEARFHTLLAATGFQDDTEGFFSEVLSQLSTDHVGTPVRVEIGGVTLPYHLVLALLEQVIPGDRLFDVNKVRQLERLTKTRVPEAEREAMQQVLDRYPVRLSSHVLRQMRLSSDVAYQYMPSIDELDPEGLAHTWVGQFHRGVVEQMYRNRVIFVLNMSCPVYCRFCFRKHKECRTQKAPTQKHVDLGVTYIKECPEIREIVLTGGDPFMNRPTLTRAIDRLGNIRHVEILRLATRSLSFHPGLFTIRDGFWINYLKRKQLEFRQKGKRIEVATHFIHPDEISVHSLEAISELVSHGVPVYVQTPFLGGCNDSGDVLTRLFSALRGAGAEMHYIFMPCSPIQGNSRYRSSIAQGLEAAGYLRSHLSDRAIPHLCTATSIGKIDWGTSGWVVERDSDDPRYLWLRTPYTHEYFESFAPIVDLSHVARPNSEGTLDAKFMVEVGDPRWRLGSREDRGLARSYLDRSDFPDLEAEAARAELEHQARSGETPLSVVDTGSATLFRPHATRVELDCDADDAEMSLNLNLIVDDRRVTDVVLFSERDPLRAPRRVGTLIGRLADIGHVNAVRLRSRAFVFEPEDLSDAMIKRVASWNRLSVVNPLRLEVEIQLLHPEQLGPQQARIANILLQRGVSVYNSTPLLAFLNDSEEVVASLTAQCRRLGIEMHHLIVAGAPIQESWNRSHPIQVSQVVDLASHLRRTASGRELPRFIVRTTLGEVDLGLSAEVLRTDDDGQTWLRLLAYRLEDYRDLEPGFELPVGLTIDDDGHPIVPVGGMIA